MYSFQQIARLLWLAPLLIITGCGQPPLTPQQQAEELFGQREFDQAIELVDQILADADSVDRVRHAKLLTLKGRCYWEKSDEAFRMKRDEDRTQLLERAYDALTESIQLASGEKNLTAQPVSKYAFPGIALEALDIRSGVLHELGREEESLSDTLARRSLDPEFHKAYINERPEDSLAELLSDRSDDDQDPADAEPSPDERPFARAGRDDSTPPAEATAAPQRDLPTRLNATTQTAARDATDDEDEGGTKGQTGTNTSRASSRPDLADQPTDDENTSDEQQEEPRRLTKPRQRAPGSQFAAPDVPSFLPRPDYTFQPDHDYLGPAPTGIVGSRRNTYPSLGGGAAGPPTTGISIRDNAIDEPGPLAVPSTGIGAGLGSTGTGSLAGTQLGSGTGVTGSTGIGRAPSSFGGTGLNFGDFAGLPNIPRQAATGGLGTGPAATPGGRFGAPQSSADSSPSGIISGLPNSVGNPFGTAGPRLPYTGALPQNHRPADAKFPAGLTGRGINRPGEIDFSRGPFYNPLHPNPTLDPNLLRIDPTR